MYSEPTVRAEGHAAAPAPERTAPDSAAPESNAPRSAGSSVDRLLGSSSSTGSWPSQSTPSAPPRKVPDAAVVTPQGLRIQNRGDILGPYSAHVGFRSGDLGAMAPLGNGEFAMIFGDSFRGPRIGEGEWMSPVGVVATIDDHAGITVTGPLNRGRRVEQTIAYARNADLTLIPSDIINIDGTLYLQGMWNFGLGNVDRTEIWRSDDGGKRWRSVGTTPGDYMSGMGELISWEQGPDGYIYVVSTSFKRADEVFLSRFHEEDLADRTTWELFDPTTGQWGTEGTPILNRGVKAGELNLRYIDGHWVLVMFNEATLTVEARISDRLDRDWDKVKVADVAKHGAWSNTQTPMNWSQPYGGYVVPGSTLANMGIVVSQWNTDTGNRYMSTQFNVEGLDRFFGIGDDADPEALLRIIDDPQSVPEPPAPQPAPQTGGTGNTSTGSSDAEVAAAVLGVFAVVAGLVAMNWQTLRPLLPEQLRAALPF